MAEEDRNASGVVTTGRMRGSDAGELGGEALSSSLFALQQVLQRENGEAISAALNSLATRVLRRDAAAIRVVDAWIASSPRLTELFRAASLFPEEPTAVLRAFRCAFARIRNDEHARDAWHRVAREWGAMVARCLRGREAGVALEALESAVRRVSEAARVVASWLAGDADRASAWSELAAPPPRTKRSDRQANAQRCVSLATALLRSKDRVAKLAVLDEGRGAIHLLLTREVLLTRDADDDERASRFVDAIAREGFADGAQRRACLRACASEAGLAAVRALAARPQTRREALALVRRVVMDDRWLEVARAGAPRPEHLETLCALDPGGDKEELELAVAAVRAAPALLPHWLSTAARSTLSPTRPWDRGGATSERSTAGCAALRAMLRAPAGRALEAKSRDLIEHYDVVGACMPPEDVLSKKELSRGALHANDAARERALELVLEILERYGREVRELFPENDRYGDWEESEDMTQRLVDILERSLTPEGASREDDRLVSRLLATTKDETQRRLKFVRSEARKLLRSRLPEVQTLLAVVTRQGAGVSLAIAALRRYCSALPRAVAESNWDVLRALAGSAENPGLRDQLAGLARAHPTDQTQRLRRPRVEDKTALRVRGAIFFEMARESAPVRSLVDATLEPLTNSPRERRIWLRQQQIPPAAFFRLLDRADQLKLLPARAFDPIVSSSFARAMRASFFLEEDDEDEETPRAGLVSPLACAGLLLLEDPEVAGFATRAIFEIAHSAGAGDPRFVLGLCAAVEALAPPAAKLSAFARALGADLRGGGEPLEEEEEEEEDPMLFDVVPLPEGKEACVEACLAAGVGIARSPPGGAARSVARDAQRRLLEYLVSREPGLAAELDSSLVYDDDDPATILVVLAAAPRAPRALAVAERLVLENRRVELAPYVSLEAARRALDAYVSRDDASAVAAIVSAKPLSTPRLADAWLRWPDAPAAVDAAVVPTSRLDALRLIEDAPRIVDACWTLSSSSSSSESRRRAARRLAAAMVAVSSRAAARLRRLIVASSPREALLRCYDAVRLLDALPDTYAAAEVGLAVSGELEEEAGGVIKRRICARRRSPGRGVVEAAAHLASDDVDGALRRIRRQRPEKTFAAVARYALEWIANSAAELLPAAAAGAVRRLAATCPRAVVDIAGYAPLEPGVAASLAEAFRTGDEAGGRALLRFRERPLRGVPLDPIVEAAARFPETGVRLLDALAAATPAARDAVLSTYGMSLSSTDRVGLRVLQRCGLPADRAGAILFSLLEPRRVAASVSRFPLRRGVLVQELASDDEEPPVELPEEEDEEEEEDEASRSSEEEEDETGGDDFEAEDSEDEECSREGAWRAAVYDPRFALPAIRAALDDDDETGASAENEARRVFESGAVAYAAAALASKRRSTRALAAAVASRFATKLASATTERGFVARPLVRALLDATFAALREASNPLRGPKRLPCLWASVIARCVEALASPRRAGFGVAASHALRRAVAKPWTDAPLMRDAYDNDSGCLNFGDDSKRDAVKARFWAHACLVDGTRDEHDARALKRSKVFLRAMFRADEMTGAGFRAIVDPEGRRKLVMVAEDAEAPPGAEKLLERGEPSDLLALRKIRMLARAEGDAALRLLASVGRSRYGRRLLVASHTVPWLCDRIATAYEARDVEFLGAVLHSATDDLDYFTERTSPFLFAFVDLAADSVVNIFYSYLDRLRNEKKKKTDPKEQAEKNSEDDEDDDDEFLREPLVCAGDFGEESRADLNLVDAAARFFFRRYLVVRRVKLAKIKRLGRHSEKTVLIEEAWRISKAAVLDAYEDVDLRTAAVSVLRAAASSSSSRGGGGRRLVYSLAPPLVLFLSQQLFFLQKDNDPIGNRLYAPLLEFYVALLVARLVSAVAPPEPCLVSKKRQLIATLNFASRAAKLNQGRPGVDALVLARFALGPAFGLEEDDDHEPFLAPPRCPLHRVDDLARRADLLATEDRATPTSSLFLDLILADAIRDDDDDKLCTDSTDDDDDDDIILAAPPPPEATYRRALDRLEARAARLAAPPSFRPDLRDAIAQLFLDDVRPTLTEEDIRVDIKFCDVCSGKVPLEDYLPKKQKWWKVDTTPGS
ncbi:hypothetical protein CTAYLR_003567 [Chrysophaeum taylorii]|uniref:URB1 C-terminal domain-containing protein n=1 Tax=Chrysophaeum taylorii TaxID=2483200 RepID=A0AAD7UN77_9STRA|nr:hypothetical protein CTAYLR_003567 [Chrysophaeum taylorii]